MKLKKIALVAEIVSSIAIVATLVILMLEIRANTNEIRVSTEASIAARTQSIPLALMTSPDLARIVSRIYANEELTPEERAQAIGFQIIVLKLAEEAFLAHSAGRLDEEIWLTRAAVAVNNFGFEQNRTMWEGELGRSSRTFSQGFVEWFDAALLEKYGRY